MTPRAHRALAWTFVVVASIIFVARGPLRTLGWGDDLAPPYGAARAWLLGANPYTDESLSRVLLAAGRETDAQGKPAFNPSLYPPPSFVALAPFAIVSWPAARAAFLVLCLVLFAAHLKSLLRVADLSVHDAAGVWLLGGVIALAPYHTGIAVAQVAIPSVTLLVISIDRIHRGHERSGGALLALATLFKPQIAAPFILYFALRRHQRAAMVALGICIAATIVGIGWLAINDIPWLESWQSTTRSILVPGSHHDPAGPWSPQLVELRPLITALTGIQSSGVLGFAIAALLGVGVFAMGKALSAQHDLLLLSAVAVLMLFATYHRFYDATVVCLPLAWAAATISRRPRLRRQAIGVAACCAVFFAPGAWMLQRLVNDGTVSAATAQSFLWNAILLRHQNWALVALFVCLWHAIREGRRLEILEGQ